MLATAKQNVWIELVSGASHQELVWMNGFLSGVLSSTGSQAGNPQQDTLPVVKSTARVTIVYATETGNSKSLAGRLAAFAKQQGVRVKLTALDQYRLNDLRGEDLFFIVVSTQGDGELPVTAVKFYDHVQAGNADLSRLQYAVLALGDSSYPLFCKAGEDMDTLLAAKGATRFVPLLRCDTDYEQAATGWFQQAILGLNNATDPAASGINPPAVVASGKKSYKGSVLLNIDLNDRGSEKETRHMEISADGILYEPGDAIGIVPENPQPLVERLLVLAGVNRDQEIIYREERDTLYHFLKKKLNIVYLPERTVRKYAEIVQQDIPVTKIGLEDLLRIYPVQDFVQFEQVIGILEPVTPRLYSISSSPAAHEGEVHLTVSRDRYYTQDEVRYGLCSDYLSALQADSEFSFYIHPNKSFRLPEPDRDIIMIGPGTGIAPFRSFLAERDATMATGRNWLFFGDQHFVSDFLYQTEIQSWFETGLLTKVNTAFSRDQREKVYVQHRMQEHGAELFNWLEQGAHIYVCGAKTPMSADVEQVLLQIIAEHGHKSETDAVAYLETLKESSRYLKDVY